LDLREPEVEHAHRDTRAVGEQDVRRLHVAMDDPALMRVREPIEDLNRRLDRCFVVELATAHRLAKGAAGDVLVGDVHVLRVAAKAVRALTRGMAQPGRGLRLPLGTRGRLAFTRDDLQGHVEPVLLVPGQPDGARAAAPQGAEWPVPPEHELALEEGWGGVRHQLSWVGRAGEESSPAEPRVRVTQASAG